MQNVQFSLNQDKHVYDSNKENYTPSSYLSSSSKLLSHQKIWNDNSLKLLRDKKENLLNSIETNDSEYYRLLKLKEDLVSKVMDIDSLLFKEKADLEKLNDELREKENKRKSIIHNSQNTGNVWLENYLLSDNFFILDNVGTTNQIHIKLKNDLALVGKRGRDIINCTGLINTKTNASTANLNEIFDKEFNQDQEMLMLYAAYNIL